MSGEKPKKVVPVSARKKPTPVRELSEATAPSSPETDLKEVVVEADDGAWTVRVIGRGGGIGSSPPLLMLGFWSEGSTSEEHDREALVVGRLLSELGPGRLDEALRTSRPPLPGDRPRPFFADGGGRRRK